MSLSVAGSYSCCKVHFNINIDVLAFFFFFLINIIMIYIFPFFYFQSEYIIIFNVSFLSAPYSVLCLLIHSANLCPLSGCFSYYMVCMQFILVYWCVILPLTSCSFTLSHLQYNCLKSSVCLHLEPYQTVL